MIYSALVLATHPEWSPGFYEVWDFRLVSTLDFAPSSVIRLRQLEEALHDQLAGSETVVITGGRSIVAFATRFYDGLLRPLGRSAQACHTEQDALSLLGVDRIPNIGVLDQDGKPQTRPSAENDEAEART